MRVGSGIVWVGLVTWAVAMVGACAVNFPEFQPTGSGGTTSSSTGAANGGGGNGANGGGGAGANGGSGGGGGTVCTTSDDCNDMEPCTTDSCGADHHCKNVKLADDTPVPGEVDIPNDCFVFLCKGGVSTKVAVPTDVPDDVNDCTTDTCVGTMPKHAPLADGHACGSGQQCHGGQCGCNDVSECPASTACITVTCEGSPQKVCKSVNVNAGIEVTDQSPGDCHHNECDGNGTLIAVVDVTDLPADDGNACTTECATDGTAHKPVPNGDPVPGFPQVGGDCKVQVCNGVGGQTSRPDDTDVPPSDGKPCTLDTCVNGLPYPPTQIDTACGSGFCDGMGSCVQCNHDAQCTGSGATCVNHTCTCVPNSCQSLMLSCGVTGDGCGNSITCSDGMKDFNETDVDCGGPAMGAGVFHCPTRCSNGQRCGVDADCASGHCVDNVCCNVNACGTCQTCNGTTGMPGTCTLVPQGATDPGTCSSSPPLGCNATSRCACSQTGQCLKGANETCTTNSQCANGLCSGGVCN